MNILIVVDMQNDFVRRSGDTGGAADRACCGGAVAAGIRRGADFFFTRDTHGWDYLHTREGGTCLYPTASGGPRAGRSSSGPACQRRTSHSGQASFGSAELGRLLAEENEKELIEKVTLIGLCTDICVISTPCW
ncbi:MAG: cysteine hydrolase family protein [Dysosmobacter welbionis]